MVPLFVLFCMILLVLLTSVHFLVFLELEQEQFAPCHNPS